MPSKQMLKSSLFRFFYLFFFLLSSSAVYADTYGAIEIGGKGVKAYAIEINDTVAKIIHREAKNIAPQSGILNNGTMNKGMVELISTQVLYLQQNLIYNQHIPKDKIFIVASSAINKIYNKQELVTKIQNSTQSTLSFIDEREESLYGFYGVVPQKEWGKAAMIDIGGGNTKIAWFPKTDNNLNFFEIPFGTVSLSKAADAQKNTVRFENKCENIASDIVISAQNLDFLNKVETLYVSGGIFWATAYFKKNGHIETFENLTKVDFENLKTSFLHEEDNIPCDSHNAKCFLKSSYGLKNLLAGAILSDKLIDKLGFFNKKIYFAKDGTWIIGWIVFKNLKTP